MGVEPSVGERSFGGSEKIMIVGGIDPGINGGIASLEGLDILIAYNIPSVKAKARGQTIDWVLLASIIQSMDYVDHWYVEEVSAMPKQGVSSTFKFGYVAGAIRGMLALMGKPVTMVRPQVWKPKMQVMFSAVSSSIM